MIAGGRPTTFTHAIGCLSPPGRARSAVLRLFRPEAETAAAPLILRLGAETFR